MIKAVGCIIYAAFQGGMKKKRVKSSQPSDCKFMETASSSTTTQNETDRGFARWTDEWMSGWLDGLADTETNTAKVQIDLRSLAKNNACVPDH